MLPSEASTGAFPALARTFTSTAAALERIRPSSASLRAKRAISESYSSHSGMALARASFGSFCRASEQEYWHGYHSTYCQRILTEVDCLGSVETVLATPSFTLERILSANLGYFELPQPTQSQSSCKENYGPENIEQDRSMKR